MSHQRITAPLPVLELAELPRLIREFEQRFPAPSVGPQGLLVLGPRAANKERLARLVHAAGDRRSCPFVVLDAAAPPPGLGVELATPLKQLRAAHGGAIYVSHLTRRPSPRVAALFPTIESGLLPPLDGDDPSAVDVQLIGGADVLWRDARQDEAVVISTPVSRMLDLLTSVADVQCCRKTTGLTISQAIWEAMLESIALNSSIRN